MIRIPYGTLAADDEAAKKRREEIKQRLLDNKEVLIDPRGTIQTPGTAPDNAIQVPPGKLASFYWYESDSELLAGEQSAMQRFFPKFRQDKLSDGRLSWVGSVTPGIANRPITYTLQVIYDHNHPSNSTYGGSIRVYCVTPDLEELYGNGDFIPHTLRDPSGNLYLCTIDKESFASRSDYSHSAASAISWAVKWFTVFELYLEGAVTEQEFRSHAF